MSRVQHCIWETNALGAETKLNLVTTIEELLERESSGSGLQNREYGRRDPSLWPRGTLYPQKVGTNFADKRPLLGRYSSFADSGHGDFFAPQLYSRGRVDPDLDPLLRKSGSAENRTQTSGSVARNSDH
jgi:hypothetical protein